MDITYNYFNNKELWNNGCSNRDLHRIKKVISIIPENVKSILDAGCGNGILVNQLVTHENFERIHGLDISEEALKFVNTAKSIGSISDMPFKDDEFDVVVSLEVLEHLSVPDFKNSLKEISRVARKYIVISIPNNEDLEKRFIQCDKCKTKFHFTNHVRSFDENSVINLFKEYNFINKEILLVGKKTNFKYISNLKRYLKKKSIQHTHRVVCPACKNVISPNKTKSKLNSDSKEGSKNLLKHLKHNWPTNKYYDWIVALYELK